MSSKIRQVDIHGAFPVGNFKDTPLTFVRTVYAAFVQGLFAAAPKGSGYHWDPDMFSSEIIITDESPINTDTIGIRPAVTFTRGPVQSYTLGIDDMLQFDLETGAKKRSVLIPGTMSINCCSRSDIESENLAWWISEAFWMHKEEILKIGGFFDIGKFVLGSPSPAGSIVAGDSADEWFCTTVSSPFQLFRTSQRTPLGAHVAQHIDFTLASKLGKVINAEGPLGQVGANLPYEVKSTLNNNPNCLQPHPLNPAQTVVVRTYRPHSAAYKHAAKYGTTVQNCSPAVEESEASETTITKVKV